MANAKTLLSDESSSSASSDDDGDDGDDDDRHTITINKKFATEYTSRKRREELKTVEQRKKHGSSVSFHPDVVDDDDDSDSSSESEDEDGELLTPKLDTTIVRTIRALRQKDERIYDGNVRFFAKSTNDDDDDSDNDDDDVDKSKKKYKAKRYKDIVREQVLEQMDQEENGDGKKVDLTNHTKDTSNSNSSLTYNEEQKALRSAFLEGVAESDDDDEDDTMFRTKNRDEIVPHSKEEEVLQEELETIAPPDHDDTAPTIDDPRGMVDNPDKFLFDFIKHKRWIDKSEKDVDNDTKAKSDDEDDDDSVERMEEFESKYNFRFEEAQDEATMTRFVSTPRIVSYARSSVHTMRKADDKRKQARSAKKDRKAKEKLQKEEKLRRLKNARREEMEDKMKMVLRVKGDTTEDDDKTQTLQKLLLEGDYNEDTFEKAMQELYSDDYYNNKEDETEDVERIRREIMAEEGLTEINVGDEHEEDYQEGEEDDAYAPDTGETYPHAEEDYNHEDDYDEDQEEEQEQQQQLPKELQDKISDQLYKLDYEDMIGDMPCRFKYRQVEANNYGLSTQEILFAKDSALKRYVSLKKMAPYNTDHDDNEGEYHVNGRKRKHFRDVLKRDWDEHMNEQMMSKENHKYSEVMDVAGAAAVSATKIDDNDDGTKKKRRRQKKKKPQNDLSVEEEEEEQDAIQESNNDLDDAHVAVEKEEEEEEPTKKRRRKKKGKKINKNQSAVESSIATSVDDHVETTKQEDVLEAKRPEVNDSDNAVDPAVTTEKKKKKKKKKNKAITKLESETGVPASRLASYGL